MEDHVGEQCPAAEGLEGGPDVVAPASPLDQDPRRFKEKIEQLIREDAGDDDQEMVLRWRWLLGWAYNRTNNPEKKKKVKRLLIQERGTTCEGECKRKLKSAELQMHRLDKSYANDRATNFGYFAKNVELLCVLCHRHREGLDLEMG